ncbi:MAG: SDR family oxidoreductase [Candidatus Brocadiae bacterium]|nr:SDR family oxidoreductase [Candidatus Brocadiia bacterium]
MDMYLKDKVAIVTGGSRGLGKAIALGLAAEGAKVGVVCRTSRDRADATVEEIRTTHGTEAVAALADVSVEADVARLFDQVEAALGPVDVLVNNAAIAPACPTAEMPLDEWQRAFAVNVQGTFLCSRELVRRLLAAGRTGRIVNISSQAAFRGSRSGKTAYDASKGAVISFTISLALEMSQHGIAVNCVAPGLMYTEMLKDVIDANREKYESRVPLHRIGTVAEIAHVVVFLSSGRASYMTGATVDVSGGLGMH